MIYRDCSFNLFNFFHDKCKDFLETYDCKRYISVKKNKILETDKTSSVFGCGVLCGRESLWNLGLVRGLAVSREQSPEYLKMVYAKVRCLFHVEHSELDLRGWKIENTRVNRGSTLLPPPLHPIVRKLALLTSASHCPRPDNKFQGSLLSTWRPS